VTQAGLCSLRGGLGRGDRATCLHWVPIAAATVSKSAARNPGRFSSAFRAIPEAVRPGRSERPGPRPPPAPPLPVPSRHRPVRVSRFLCRSVRRIYAAFCL